jgi:hypothetical protein
VTSRLGTGKPLSFFYSVSAHAALACTGGPLEQYNISAFDWYRGVHMPVRTAAKHLNRVLQRSVHNYLGTGGSSVENLPRQKSTNWLAS